MSGQQQKGRYSSKIGQMFGYVTPEDQAKWHRMLEETEPSTSAVKAMAESAAESAMEFNSQNVKSRLSAAHKVAMEEEHLDHHQPRQNEDREPEEDVEPEFG